MATWVPDIAEDKLNEFLKKHKLKKKEHLQSLKKCPPEIQADMIKNKIYSPITTWYDPITFVVPEGVRSRDYVRIQYPGDGYRTKIPLNVTVNVPPQSLIFVGNMWSVVPDGCHMTVRIVEKDLKLFAEFLLTRGRTENLQQLQSNIILRDVKNQKFRFSAKNVNSLSKSSEINEISLSGRDARAIIADPEQDLKNTGVGCIFNGVLYNDRAVPNKHKRPVEILQELDVLVSGPYVTENALFPSELTIGRLLFSASNQISK